jgi:hypothetical protein
MSTARTAPVPKKSVGAAGRRPQDLVSPIGDAGEEIAETLLRRLDMRDETCDQDMPGFRVKVADHPVGFRVVALLRKQIDDASSQ